jgi:phospholipid-binding lipoprotein MlaA
LHDPRFDLTVSATRVVAALAVAALLSGCAAPPPPAEINDPYEARNRAVHEANRDLDRIFVRGASNAYGNTVPEPVRESVGNFASNLDQPRLVVNNILQGRAENALHNTFRFLVNSTFGIAGLFDPATDMGLAARDTDFGETLHVWGAGEGAYVELPVLGPSTERDTVGRVVDIALNPLRYADLTSEQSAGLFASSAASRIGDRYRFSSTVDSILYDSADSYAQARLIYLQNRRFQLGQETSDAAFDPYYDPYEDPYAE